MPTSKHECVGATTAKKEGHPDFSSVKRCQRFAAGSGPRPAAMLPFNVIPPLFWQMFLASCLPAKAFPSADQFEW